MNVSRPTNVVYAEHVPDSIPENLYKEILMILKNSYKIPASLLDDKKNLIVKISMLKKIIAMLLNVPPNNVFIDSISSDSGCCGVTDPIEDIEDIIIKSSACDFKSLKIFYNEMYNRITTDFKISLKKVINIGDD